MMPPKLVESCLTSRLLYENKDGSDLSFFE